MKEMINRLLSRNAVDGNLRAIKTSAEVSRLRELNDLASNDYLGLAHRPELVEEFLGQVSPHELLMTSSASRLLSLRQEAHEALETKLASLYGREALLFNSGYHANVGTVAALGSVPGTLIVADRLVHASIIDGIVLSRADFRRFRHNSIADLRAILQRNAEQYHYFLIVVESIYSMDGGIAPIEEIVALRREFPQMFIYVDEAHAFGVRGERGLGVLEELGLINQVDVVVGTLGKAAASTGAFVIADDLVKRYLVNSARSLIFSTALPPVNCAWSSFIIDKIVKMTAERARLARLSAMLYEHCNEQNGEVKSESQIVPLVVGDAGKVVRLSERLREEGFVALPIRRPTVPAGTERIRFSLNASLAEDEILRLISVIDKLV